MKSIKLTLGILFLISGVLLILVYPLSYRISSLEEFHFYLSQVNASVDPIEIDESLISDQSSKEHYPTRILIPKNDIDLEISPAKAIKGRWEVFGDKAGFGLGSATPEEVGNTVVFAHAKDGLFLNLKNTKLEDEILIFTDKNWFSYKVSEIKEVNPRDISVIGQTDDSTLTLFTCSGFADSKRLIVVANKLR